MNKSDLYTALVSLCQQSGFTTERTYERLHEAIASIREDDDGEESPREPWLDDSIQFPRLLSEIWAMGLTPAQRSYLQLEMDLNPSFLNQLFERADRRWQAIKDQTGPGRKFNSEAGGPGVAGTAAPEAKADDEVDSQTRWRRRWEEKHLC